MQSSPSLASGADSLRKPTVLCADDDLDVLGTIEMNLRDFDVNLVRAFDGMEAFGEALVHKPDVIVLDLNMPFGDGMLILECFRRNVVTQQTPIIILTGCRDQGLKKKLIRMGADAFLTKPFTFDQLVQQMRRFVPLPKRI